MIDLGTILPALEGIRALSALAKGATSAAVDHQLKEQLISIQQGILDTQSQLVQAQAERLELLNELHEIRVKLRAAEAIKQSLDGYALHAIGEGVYVYKPISTDPNIVPHYACTTCYSAGGISILQASKVGSQSTAYACKTCNNSIRVGPSDPPQPIPYRDNTTRRG